MKKSDLIEDLAATAEVTKSQARIMIDRLVELIQTGVRKEGRIPLTGLGTFAVGKRAARTRPQPSDRRKAQDQGNQHRQVPCRAGPESRRQAAVKKFKG
jgi:DNA-binding protein HU-beta